MIKTTYAQHILDDISGLHVRETIWLRINRVSRGTRDHLPAG